MQVSVLGCGWLGLPLAKALVQLGHTVKGTTTTPDKLHDLKAVGISPYLLNLDNASAEGIQAFLQGSEVLIINIPPKLKTATVTYPDKMQLLLPHIKNSGIASVLFVSSTSVYADAFSFPEITEDTPPNSDAENGRQLLQAEQTLQNSPDFKTTIIRPAGLIGNGRHPINQLAGREGIAHPNAPINLISQADVLQVMLAVLAKNTWNEVFNIANPQHPAREAYYTAKAEDAGLALPQFNHAAQSIGKIINGDKAEKVLGVRFSEGI
ncbi:MAG: SDR family oxidoreductase [Sphingobacteriales bacterium]|nr:MAG: SDR family oxidoreductase [Sphingobacteriales bacterium]